MKGLLIKDFKLLMGQKRFLLIVIGMGVLLMFTGDDPSTAIGYIVMLLTIFTLNTISYDEYENGMNFILTLPITRKTYVQEKFVFAGLLAVSASIISMALASVAMLVRDMELNIPVVAVVTGLVLGAAIGILAIMMPLEIKFGAEKGRVAMFGVFAAMGLILALAVKLTEKMGVNVERMWLKLSIASPKVFVLLAVIALILVLLASYFICMRIILKKEY